MKLGWGGLYMDFSMLVKLGAHLVGENLTGVLGDGDEDSH